MKAGSRIGGDLRLVRALGQGAAGSVWEAQRGDGRKVAVKFAARHIIKDPTERARFAREATLAMSLQSKHIVESTGYGVGDDGLPYIVMELLRGETLEERLRRDRVIGPEELVRILAQAAEALDEAHEKDIVHRDVKPSNLFLTKKKNGGEDILVKVLDFGMAKRTAVPNPSVVTAADIAVGTPDYMSPEQIRNAREVDRRVDVWALGVIAYRGLIGRLPFKSDTFAGLCVTITVGKFDKPTDLAPYLPRELDKWFTRMLSVDREKRFPTAGEAVAALRDALSLDIAIQYKEADEGAPPPKVVRGDEPAIPKRSAFNTVFTIMVAITALLLGAIVAMYDGF
jgi:serine/threonine-protein kinase